ncbi:MAG: helix-turn-helix domain-containing protein, partial [Thermomicrobiales bacterium]
MSLGDLIRRYRLSAGLSQEDLAERAGLSVRGISDLERGRRLSPHMETLRLLSDGLGLADEARAALIAAARPELTAQASAVGIAEQPQPASEPRVRALPTPPTALVGQSDLIARLVGHISENGVRLVTLTGPGGVGKTRVGLEAGRLLADSFADGALFLDLGLLSSSQQLGPALLDALAFTGNQGPDPVSQLIDLQRDASMLLIL